MFAMKVTPRFYETDALGHINNTVLSNWFEAAREPVFRVFNPGLELGKWNLILARVAIDYVAQTHYGKEVEVRSWIGRIGNSSFVVEQEAWQEGERTGERRGRLQIARSLCLTLVRRHHPALLKRAKPRIRA